MIALIAFVILLVAKLLAAIVIGFFIALAGWLLITIPLVWLDYKYQRKGR